MELVIITGMSGAGKSTAANALEDIGFYCVDNVPPKIIPAFVDLSRHGNAKLDRLAIVTDLRGGEMFRDITGVLDELTKGGMPYKIIFFETSDAEIVRRYRENRRIHPLYGGSTASLAEAVEKERNLLAEIRLRADYVIDSTYMGPAQLKSKLQSLFTTGSGGNMKIQCMSFGFKHGFAAEADLVFDLRCLPNPFYDQSLKPLTGIDRAVQDYVLSTEEAKEFYTRLLGFLDYSIPLYQKEGKGSLVLAFGCTGGQHRSVTFAELVATHLTELGYVVGVNHRDMGKSAKKG